MDITPYLESFGYIVIFICVFIECGVLLGLILPLPGSSLLFTAGVFASQDKINLAAVLAVGTIAAVLGYVAGYYTGLHYGRKLFYEKDTQKYFTREQGLAAERFMRKYGYSTLIIGRFLPILHTAAPILSGMARTPLVAFMFINVVGGLFWVSATTMLGYYLGHTIPNAQYYVLPFLICSAAALHTPYGKHVLARITSKIESL